MFLRSLTLRGFKSFADKTVLEFTPGISVIVGPNGSGKSNVADAIAWVLGEQGPRALRGGQMTDVIFAGSPSRPPLGLAEVKMVIDNSAGLIPVPASEIEISRSIYRSGESEYRLGGRPCRLLDIQELLSDTGVGRTMHTIVGQGQLDDILTARPEERRQFIEEAAGIAKHRRRRERAERKLSGLETDLNRLQDLVGELKRQLKPLKQQAELAERHESLNREAGDLSRKLAAARLRDLFAERERRRPSWQQAEVRQAEIQERLSALDAEIARLETEKMATELALHDAEDLHARCLDAKSEAEGRLRVAIRDEADARERLTGASNRSGRLFALDEELHRTEAALSEVRASLQSREADLDGEERSFRQREQARRDAEEERRRVGEQIATRRAEAEALRRGLANQAAELDRLRATRLEVTERAAAAEARAAQLEAEIERLDGLATPLVAEHGKLETERAGVNAALRDLETQEQGLLARQEVVDARREELSESPGAAFARRRGDRPIGMLRDLLDTPPDLKAALLAALGPLADAVAYASWEHAEADARVESVGGVSLVVEGGSDHCLPSIYGERSLHRSVKPDPRVRRLAGQLLGEVYVVNNLAEAVAKHRVHPYATFVTLDGAVAGTTFVRMPAGRDARLEQVRRDSASIERELSGLRRGQRESRRRLAEIEARAEVVQGEIEESDRKITSAAEELARMEAERTSLGREEQLIAERIVVVESAVGAAREGLGEQGHDLLEPPALPAMPEPPIHLRVEVEALRRERSRLEAGVDRARRELEKVASEDPIKLRETLQSSESERLTAEEALRNAEGNLAGALAAYRAATDASRELQDRHALANRGWREGAATSERIRQEHQDEDRARHDLERRIAEAERLLSEGHGADPGDAIAELSDEETVEELVRRADTVGRRLGLLGKVNLLATGELESVQQRHDFIVRELEDVKAARRDLQEVIRDVDRRVGEMFMAAFDDVAREFSELFALMFPGGEGRLTLTDPDDLLASGIEVEARPGRGKVKRLSLLSGGERSLAALAFLFAIFKARPSPFYLMDEVEAALDDVNLHRFLELVKSFAEDSQILIVTHQKRTMETADVLYGVSRSRDGASTVISQRLAEVTASV
jgi:chromosome segregation protein